MAIVVENLDVRPEAAPAPQPPQPVPGPSTASQPASVEVEKMLRRALERMARIHAS